MNSRERTFRALSFEEPDRVPIDFWISRGFRMKIESSLNQSMETFLDLHDVDLRYIDGPAYIGPPLKKFSDGQEEDIWGVLRRTVTLQMDGAVEVYKEVVRAPLALAKTVEEINNYGHWPSSDWFDYSMIEEQCNEIRRQERVVVFMGDRLNRIAQLKPAMYIRGVEEIFTDMGLNPEIAKAIFSNISSFYSSYAERILEAAKGKLDIFLMGDDFGSQDGLLLSPKMWVDFIGSGFTNYIDMAKSCNVFVMHHTCGSVRALIPLMIERGLDILQSIQPEASGMNPRELKSEFGKQLAFHGGISIQKTLPFGTPDDVRKEVREKVEALAPGGGYILCTAHNIQADTPVENVKELLKAYKDYGCYS